MLMLFDRPPALPALMAWAGELAGALAAKLAGAGELAWGPLAQAALPDGGVPLPDIGNLTATAILGWYAWHTASRAIPGLVAHFRDEAAAARAEFRLEREAFHEALRQEREQRHADNAALVEALGNLAERMQS
jgi:hypothetical protein